MAQIAPKEDIEKIREGVSISEVVSQYVSLKTAGIGTRKGLCPFHDEKTPSFTVNDNSGYFHCFGCGESGDVFTFLMKLNGLSFQEAIKVLADRARVSVNWKTTAPSSKQADSSSEISRTKIVEVNNAASSFFSEQLESEEAKPARDMLLARTFTKEQCEQFGCGYAPKGWDSCFKYLTNRGFTIPQIDAAGLISKSQSGSYIDRFRGRVIWPIKDVAGDVLGFGARKLYDDDNGPKYLNTGETKVYKKSRVLYGIDKARKPISKERICVVCEGYTDVMAMNIAGIETAVASCGTAFGTDHIKIVNRLMGAENFGGSVIHEKVGKVILVFDGDEAGMNAARKTYANNQEFAAFAFVTVLPDGLDPCDYRIKHGDAALRNQVLFAKPIYEYILETVVSQFDTSPEGLSQRLKSAIPIVKGIKDISTRNGYVKKLQTLTGQTEADIKKALSAYRPQNQQQISPQNSQNQTQNSAVEVQNPTQTSTTSIPAINPNSADVKLIAMMLQRPKDFDHDLFYEIEKDYLSKNLQPIFEVIDELGGTIVGSSYSNQVWINMIIENLKAKPTVSPAQENLYKICVKMIQSLAALSLDITEKTDLPRYSKDLLLKIILTGKTNELNTLKTKLRLEQNQDNKAKILSSINNVQREIKHLQLQNS